MKSWNRSAFCLRCKLIIAVCMLVVGIGALGWVGVKSVQASERPVALFQTIPPTPTPKPPAPLPTPTPRPHNNNKSPTSPAQSPSAPVDESAPTPNASVGVLTGVINATTLNVRQGPGGAFPVLGRLSNGAVVTVVARSVDNSWLNVCCLPDGRTKGWVSAQFVTPNYSAAELAALPVGALSGTVAAVSLNVRAAPTTTAAILGKLLNGAAVSILARNDASDWWLVCCVPGSTDNGWVSAQYIAPNANAAMLAALPVTADRNISGAMTPPEPTTATSAAASAALQPTLLMLTAALQPAFPTQGDLVEIAFTLTNTGDANAINAEISFEVPTGMDFVGASAEDGGEVSMLETDTGATLVVAAWPTLAASEATTLELKLTVAETLSNGSVIDGMTTALADNAEATSVAISVGMPPALPPDFQ